MKDQWLVLYRTHDHQAHVVKANSQGHAIQIERIIKDLNPDLIFIMLTHLQPLEDYMTAYIQLYGAYPCSDSSSQ